MIYKIRCGPGSWLLDLASKYENSYFFGIDVKPVYPNEVNIKMDAGQKMYTVFKYVYFLIYR